MLKDFLKSNKILNAWSISRENSPFGDPGDVILLFKTPEGRKIKRVSYKDKWYFYIENTPENLDVLRNRGLKYLEGKKYIRVYFPKLEYNDQSIIDLIRGLEAEGDRKSVV